MTPSYEGNISDAPGKVICELHSLNDLGDLDYFSIVDDTCFAVVSRRSVVTLFNTATGEEIRQIGHSGRAKNEYLAPTLVRTCNGKIFVGAEAHFNTMLNLSKKNGRLSIVWILSNKHQLNSTKKHPNAR